MNFVPVMLIVWGIFTAIFLALLAYNATLTRYEDDQLFLNDHNVQEQELQSSIVRNVNRTRPMVRVCGGASVGLGAVIVFMYTWDAWLKIHP